MTDPQEDKPCRDCKRPTQHDTEICDDCRTPAGRLLTELRALLIRGKAIDGYEVRVGDLLVSADPASWAICHESEGENHDGNITSAAAAVAAIVQAPALRADRDTLAAEVKRLRDALADRTQGQAIAETAADVQRAEVEQLRLELEKPVAGAWAGADKIGWFRSPHVADPSAFPAVVWAPGSFAGSCDKARHAADLALLAAGYRLVGGVHPLPDEVRS